MIQLTTLTGGRSAEEIAFGSVTSGASNDIEKATRLARAMITRFGMSKHFDMVALETVNGQYLGGDTSLACSPNTSALIDQEVNETIREAHEKALSILHDNRQKLDELAAYRRDRLRPCPQLRTLFLEMTVRCNEHCRHCGSNCGDFAEQDPLTGDELRAFLRQIKDDFPLKGLRLCIAGGEPLLRRDLFDIRGEAHRLGFEWGMTSNGTLITPEIAHRLALAGQIDLLVAFGKS